MTRGVKGYRDSTGSGGEGKQELMYNGREGGGGSKE